MLFCFICKIIHLGHTSHPVCKKFNPVFLSSGNPYILQKAFKVSSHLAVSVPPQMNNLTVPLTCLFAIHSVFQHIPVKGTRDTHQFTLIQPSHSTHARAESWFHDKHSPLFQSIPNLKTSPAWSRQLILYICWFYD